MVWAYSDAVLLGHVIAREVGARLVRGLEEGGVLDVEGDLASGSRVLILDSGSPRSVRQMLALVRNRGAQALAILSPSGRGESEIDGVPVVAREGE